MTIVCTSVCTSSCTIRATRAQAKTTWCVVDVLRLRNELCTKAQKASMYDLAKQAATVAPGYWITVLPAMTAVCMYSVCTAYVQQKRASKPQNQSASKTAMNNKAASQQHVCTALLAAKQHACMGRESHQSDRLLINAESSSMHQSFICTTCRGCPRSRSPCPCCSTCTGSPCPTRTDSPCIP